MKHVVVGMCVHNNLELTIRTINSVFKNTSGVPYVLYIVDDKSDHDTKDYLYHLSKQYANCVVVFTNFENIGYTKSANIILNNRMGADVVLINNDIEVTPGWLEKLVKNGGDIVGCKILAPSGQVQHEGVKIVDHKTIHGNFPHSDYVNGCCVYIKSSLLDAIGVFDEIFAPAYHEETDLCLRAKSKGFDVTYEPTCEIYHELSSSYGKRQDTGYIYNRSWGILRDRWGIVE